MRTDAEADADHPFADVLGLDQVDSAPNGLGSGHRTVAQREKIAATAAQTKKIFAEGWTQRKGGWAADFGAPHTHLLGTGSHSDGSGSVSRTRDDPSTSTSGSSILPKNTVSLTEVVKEGRLH